MTEKRFTTNGYYIFDHFKDDEFLVNEVDAQLIVDKMNNLDTKARENSKALSKLQLRLNALHEENEQLKEQNRRLSEQKHIYKQDWKHLCIDKELLDSENEGLKEDNAILKHALSRIICEFDEHIAKNSEVRDLIK